MILTIQKKNNTTNEKSCSSFSTNLARDSIYDYVCIYIYIYIHTYTSIITMICIMYTYIICVYIYICIYMYTYIHVYIYIYIMQPQTKSWLHGRFPARDSGSFDRELLLWTMFLLLRATIVTSFLRVTPEVSIESYERSIIAPEVSYE